VYYKYELEHEAIVKAKSKKEAIKKVKDVIGEDTQITASWKLERRK
jgi:flagellar biosynthesis GTPase FlhF